MEGATSRLKSILVTGSNGFIGKNLCLRLQERRDMNVLSFQRGDSCTHLQELVAQADAIVHLAGENRPKNEEDFESTNVGLTQQVSDSLQRLQCKPPVLFTSSTQVELENPYGISKRKAEDVLYRLSQNNGNSVGIFRLPGVFGKWCRPNYNSVVATFCHNIAQGLPVEIHESERELQVVYIDDVVETFLDWLSSPNNGVELQNVKPVYRITLGNLAAQIQSFQSYRTSLLIEQVGSGLTRALYSTYISYLSPQQFVHDLHVYKDERGSFAEMIKTKDSGQVSYFTAHPGVTRGSHYHHTKTEKFLVIKGKARFGFRNLLTDETYYLETSAEKPQIVDTIPGWTHEIKNIGEEEMLVMLWANEVFNKDRPDTIVSKVVP